MTTPLPVRLAELRLLKDSWFEGASSVPSAIGIDWLSDSFTWAYPEDLSVPFAYPTPSGGIRLEWSLDPYELTLDIDLANHTASLHEMNLTSDEDLQESLNLDEHAEWERLIERLRTIARGRELI